MQFDRTATIRGEQVPVTNTYRFRKAYPTREERAQVLVEQGMVHPQAGGHVWVESLSARLQGLSGQGHMVCLDGDRASCTCPDGSVRIQNRPCQRVRPSGRLALGPTHLRMLDALPPLRLPRDRAPAQDHSVGLPDVPLRRLSARLQ